jgi:hypothetical protein
MNKGIPVLLGTVLLSGTVAGYKLPAPTLVSAVPIAPITGQAIPKNTLAESNTIAAGTTFDTTLQQELSSGRNKDGDTFTLKVNTGWFAGDTVLKGAQVKGHLEGVQKAARGKKASLRLVFDEMVLKNGDRYPADLALVDTRIQGKTQGQFIKNTAIIIGGAVAGRFVGDRTGFKQGGGLAGAAAAAYVLSSPGGEVVLKKGSHVRLKFTSAFNPT